MSSYKSSISCLVLLEALRVIIMMNDTDYFSFVKDSHGATSLFKRDGHRFFCLFVFFYCYDYFYFNSAKPSCTRVKYWNPVAA